MYYNLSMNSIDQSYQAGRYTFYIDILFLICSKNATRSNADSLIKTLSITASTCEFIFTATLQLAVK